jgi:hypothetical protein
VKTISLIIGYLQKNFIILLCIGAGIEIILRYFLKIDPLVSLSKNTLAALGGIPMLLIMFSVGIFYTQEKLSEYIKPTWGGKGLAIPQPDKYFNMTIAQDIGIKRKIAGYIYAISKIHLFIFLGAEFFIAFTRFYHY